MPCTQHDDSQESQQQSRRAPFSRSTFSRAFAGLRFSDQQNFNSFRISPSHPSHIIVQPSLSSAPINPEDLTEQIRISVHDAHFGSNQRASYANGDLGGNISDVLDNFEGAISQQQQQRLPSYSGQSITQNSVDRNSSNGIQTHVGVGASRSRPHSAQSSIEQGPSSSTAYSSSSSTSSSSQTMSSRLDMTEPGHYYAQLSHSASPVRTHYIDDSNNYRIQYDQSLNNNKTSASSDDRQTQVVSAILTEYQSSDNNSTRGDGLGKDSRSTATDFSEENAQSSSSSSSDFLHSQQENISNITVDSRSDSEQAQLNSSQDANKLLHILDIIPPYSNNRQAGVIKNYLFNGSNFCGFQKNKKDSYEVKVKIQHVDYDNSYLCGYLNIKDLTQTHPLLTTFFEGEIISKQHPFLTRKWEATEEIDRAHWSKLDGFEKYLHTFNLDSFNYDDLDNSDYIYMRWKEHFFVPDHTIKHVEGTSYAGFYYVCYSKRTAQIKGYYFHITEYLEGR